MRKRSTLTISIMVLCGSMLAQSTKTLLFMRPVGHDPIRIVRVMEGMTEVQSDGKEFPNKLVQEYALIAGDDWIKDLSVVVRNVSNKTITYISVNGNLFETADWQAELAKHKMVSIPGQVNHEVGWRPEHALYSLRTGKMRPPDSTLRPAFRLAPRQQYTLSLADQESYDAVRGSVDMATINAINGGISLFFEDGTKWEHFNYYRADQEPGKWTRISFEEWSQSGQQ